MCDKCTSDPEPQPGEVVDYHEAIYAWRERQLMNEGEEGND